jgi:hypothetical protein
MAKFANPSYYKIDTDYDLVDWEAREKDETRQIEELKEKLKAAHPGNYVGELLRWQVADGYACYIVVQERPLQVAHLDVGDGYCVDPILIRGLRMDDVRAMVERERAWERLFATA